MTNKKALITGITGQDGSYLTELLLSKGYTVHGIVRRASAFNRYRIDHLLNDHTLYDKRLFLHYADLMDVNALRRIIEMLRPDELYHLAGQSHVGLSFELPESTAQEVGMATLSILEILREKDFPVKMYHASSSEVFGSVSESPQDEQTPYRPATPYGCSKAFATNMSRIYRDAHGLFVCNGILYNHESSRRSENFVTSKIVRSAAAIKLGLESEIKLGNLDAKRDWGYANDYVIAMQLMLQQDVADDYVIASGEAHSVREFLELAFSHLELDYKKYVKMERRFIRAGDPVNLIGNATKARDKLSWKPTVSFEELVYLLVDEQMSRLSKTV